MAVLGIHNTKVGFNKKIGREKEIYKLRLAVRVFNRLEIERL